jgi:glycosyltransferase involved in cell wall biosynthesis
MTIDKPRVSIGLPVYNGDSFLKETLDSLLAQTYGCFELIISDNASTDQTEDICRAYAAQDQRIRYYRNKENIGMGRNFNRVLELSSGHYFKWATADDVCKPDYLARCVDVLDRNSGVVVVYPKTQFVDETGNVLDRDDPGWHLTSELAVERLRYVIYAGHWCNAVLGLIRASALSQTRLLPSYPAGDRRLLGELALKGKFIEIPDSLFLRRLHPSASSQNTTNPKWMAEYLQIKSRVRFLPSWSLSLDHMGTIARSQLSLLQKLSLTVSLLSVMRWQRRRLLNELAAALSPWSA